MLEHVLYSARYKYTRCCSPPTLCPAPLVSVCRIGGYGKEEWLYCPVVAAVSGGVFVAVPSDESFPQTPTRG